MDYWTSKEPKEVVHCHLNYVVPDTKKWEQQAAYYLDKHLMVDAFVKNAGLGFAIPYLYNGQHHDYMPDFIVRLKTEPPIHFILETKGYDPLAEVKKGAAERWVNAVNADGTYGRSAYQMVRQTGEVKWYGDESRPGHCSASQRGSRHGRTVSIKGSILK